MSDVKHEIKTGERRREFIKNTTLGIIGLGLGPHILKMSSFSSLNQRKKNVLFLIVDDLRPVLGAYGNREVKSPYIDQLASESILFERSFAQVPVCGASRVSILTGLRIEESKNTIYNLQTSMLAPNRHFISLPKHFRGHGYYAVSLGKVFHVMHDRYQDWSESPWRSEPIYYGKHDWAHYNSYHLWKDDNSAALINPTTGRGPYYEFADVDESLYQDAVLADKASYKLRELKNKKQPFFLAVGFWRPHLPFIAPRKYWELYEEPPVSIADNRFRPIGLPGEVQNSKEITQYGDIDGWPAAVDFQKTALHAYYACVSHIDRQIGRVLQSLKDIQLSDDTIVVLTADHGWNLGEHNFWGKHNLMFNAYHVPLIIKIPGYASTSVSNIVESLDIYPTLCDLTDLPKPGYLQGKTLMPLLIDNGKDHVQEWKNQAYSIWQRGRNIITDRYSYAEWINSDSKMLFDHKIDPQENINVINESMYKEAILQLSADLHQQFPVHFGRT